MGNCLVNAMTVGVAPVDRILRQRQPASQSGCLCRIKTGRDGIHGQPWHPAGIYGDSEAKRPTVQVGDPLLKNY